MTKKKNEGCDFGYYNGLSYRICYGLKEGRMDYSIPLYEFHKDCKCQICTKRSKYDREPSNHLTVTTDDKSNFSEIAKIINKYTCDSNKKEECVYITFISGTRTYRKGFGEVKKIWHIKEKQLIDGIFLAIVDMVGKWRTQSIR